jgi:hypothetical protein
MPDVLSHDGPKRSFVVSRGNDVRESSSWRSLMFGFVAALLMVMFVVGGFLPEFVPSWARF